MNLAELEAFIAELNKLLEENKNKMQRIKPSTVIQPVFEENLYIREPLTETEAKVYVKISNYFRLLTSTVPNLSVAYEIWLKGILQILLNEVGLSFENWDRICAIGDHDNVLLDRIDLEWTDFLEDIKNGNINSEVLNLIKKGKARSNELLKKKIIHKKRNDF